jgi:alkaline phosphatase D
MYSYYKVASGDPLDTSVLLWTRAVPTPLALNPLAPPSTIPDVSVPICVLYSSFLNAKFSGPSTASGQAFTSYDVDFTVKVEAHGLKPDMQYWFKFADCTNVGSASPVGWTRTFASANSLLPIYLSRSEPPA